MGACGQRRGMGGRQILALAGRLSNVSWLKNKSLYHKNENKGYLGHQEHLTERRCHRISALSIFLSAFFLFCNNVINVPVPGKTFNGLISLESDEMFLFEVGSRILFRFRKFLRRSSSQPVAECIPLPGVYQAS